MKLTQIIKDEVVPLSSRENLILLLIISCIFQFTMFFTPVLANEAVNTAQAAAEGDLIVTNSPLIRDGEAILEKQVAIEEVARPSADSKTVEIAPEVRPEPAIEVSDKVVSESVRVITAYNSEAAQTDASPCITANGFNVCEHGVEDTIAANFLKFGTKVKIPELFGDRIFIVRDRMNKRHADRVDVWMLDRTDALKFGKRTAKIVVIE